MRIIGILPHPQLNITIFKSNTKIIFKFEIGPFEQTYKFMETEKLSNFEDAKRLIDEKFIEQVFHIFDKMNTEYKLFSTKIN